MPLVDARTVARTMTNTRGGCGVRDAQMAVGQPSVCVTGGSGRGIAVPVATRLVVHAAAPYAGAASLGRQLPAFSLDRGRPMGSRHRSRQRTRTGAVARLSVDQLTARLSRPGYPIRIGKLTCSGGPLDLTDQPEFGRHG